MQLGLELSETRIIAFIYSIQKHLFYLLLLVLDFNLEALDLVFEPAVLTSKSD